MRRQILQVAGLALLVFAAGCDIVRGCTLIGCVSGLIVHFTTAPTKPYRVEITNAGFGTMQVYECTQLNQCLDVVRFQDYFPNHATIKVITATGTTTTTVDPVYNESQPNGNGCGPTCRQASVTVPFPAG